MASKAVPGFTDEEADVRRIADAYGAAWQAHDVDGIEKTAAQLLARFRRLWEVRDPAITLEIVAPTSSRGGADPTS